MKKRKTVASREDTARDYYICLLLDFDYFLLSLHEAMCRHDQEYRLTLLDELYDAQQQLTRLEKNYPHFTRIHASV